jgi:hypothetical protein
MSNLIYIYYVGLVTIGTELTGQWISVSWKCEFLPSAKALVGKLLEKIAVRRTGFCRANRQNERPAAPFFGTRYRSAAESYPFFSNNENNRSFRGHVDIPICSELLGHGATSGLESLCSADAAASWLTVFSVRKVHALRPTPFGSNKHCEASWRSGTSTNCSVSQATVLPSTRASLPGFNHSETRIVRFTEDPIDGYS